MDAPAPTPHPRLVLGFKANGKAAYDYYRPSILEFSSALANAEFAADSAKKVPLEDSTPLPSGWRLFRRVMDQMPMLSICDIRALRYRRLYGYADGIKVANGRPDDVSSFESHAAIADVFKLWWRFGSRSEGRYESFKYCRVIAFTSTASFPERLQAPLCGRPHFWIGGSHKW